MSTQIEPRGTVYATGAAKREMARMAPPSVRDALRLQIAEAEALPGRLFLVRWSYVPEWFDSHGFLLCGRCLRRAGGPLDGCERGRKALSRVRRTYRLQLESVTGGRDATTAEIVRDANARRAVAR